VNSVQGTRTLAQQRNVIIAAVVSIIVILATVYVVAHIATPTVTPNGAEKASTTFYAAVQKQNYNSAYAILADEQQAQLTQYSFSLIAKAEDIKDGKVTTFKELRYDRDTNHSNQAAIQIQVTRAISGTYTIKLQMIQLPDGSWRILEEDRAI